MCIVVENMTMKCTTPETIRLQRDTANTSTDQLIVEKSGMQNINIDTLNKYRDLFRSNTPNHPWLNESDEELLKFLGAAEIENGEFRLTVAGLLMFGNSYEITHIIPNYHLDYRRYECKDEWTDRLNSDTGLWSGNIFDFFIDVSRRIIDSDDRPFTLNNDVIKAQREMILNSLVHADYFRGGNIVVISEKDSLTVRNSGNLCISPEKSIEGGFSNPRNPVLMKMFTLVGFAKRSGDGIRSIFRTCRMMGLPLPEIIEEYNPTCVVFRMGLKGSDEMEPRIIQLMIQNEKIGIDTIADFLGVSKSTISREITKMKNEGKISRIGGSKGRWVVNELENDGN